MRITTNMVNLMHSVDKRACECYGMYRLPQTICMAKRKLISIDMTDGLTSEEYHAVLDYILSVYKREARRIKDS